MLNLNDAVIESLNNAVANGYPLYEWSAEEIADDLAEFDSEFEAADKTELKIIIGTWLASQ